MVTQNKVYTNVMLTELRPFEVFTLICLRAVRLVTIFELLLDDLNTFLKSLKSKAA